MKRAAFLAVTATALIAGSSASALVFDFSYSTINETFDLPAMPTPTSVSTDDFVVDVEAVYNGSATPDTIQFNDTNGGGGLQSGFLGASGPQVFGGSVGAPSFTTGVYHLSGGATLDISAAPEPQAWAMMSVGVGLAGLALRRRVRRAAAR